MQNLSNKATVNYKQGDSAHKVPFSVDTNAANFEKVENVLHVHKSIYPQQGCAGDTVQFHIGCSATGYAENVVICDDLHGFTYVPDSLKIDNVAATGIPITAISIGNLNSNQGKFITFECTVD